MKLDVLLSTLERTAIFVLFYLYVFGNAINSTQIETNKTKGITSTVTTSKNRTQEFTKNIEITGNISKPTVYGYIHTNKNITQNLLTTTPRDPGRISLLERITTNIDKDCPVYKNVVPDGECIEYLRDHRVAQTSKEIKYSNDKLKRFYGESWKYIQIWFLAGKPKKSFMEKWLGKCYQEPHIKKDFDQLTIPSLENMRGCISRTKESICHLYHPTCVHKQINNNKTFQYFNRQFCSESCMNIKTQSGCNDTVLFLEACNRIIEGCPKLKISRYMSYPGCGRLLKADIKHVEKCLLVHRSDLFNISTNTATLNCYINNGKTYRGKQNITVSGKICQNWKDNPYLTVDVFPELKENYCRNPQGYGSQPWCYVDMTTKKWEYCKMSPCENKKTKTKEESFGRKYSVELIILCILATLLTLIGMLYILIKNRMKTQNDGNKTTAAYSAIPLKSSDDVVDHLREFSEIPLCEENDQSGGNVLVTPWVQQ